MSQERLNLWEDNFPNGYGHTSIDFLRNHSNRDLFIKAKAGDAISAVDLVINCIKKERILQLQNKYKDAIIVPILAKERSGFNMIPLAYAKVLQSITGFKVEENIFQINYTHHTGACAMERLLNRPLFDGPVHRGYNYIIVDDVVTQGGTVSSLRHFILNSGAKVAAISALAFAKDSTTIALQPNTYKCILEKFGRDELEEFLQKRNIAKGIQEVTNSEARYLLKFKDINAIRAKADEVGIQRIFQENRQPLREKSCTIDVVFQSV